MNGKNAHMMQLVGHHQQVLDVVVVTVEVSEVEATSAQLLDDSSVTCTVQATLSISRFTAG